MVEDLPGGQVEGEHDGVAVAGDQRETVGVVDGEAMVVVAAGQRDPAGDGGRVRVDDGKDVEALDGDEHLPGGRVVADVAGLTTDVDGAAGCADRGVQDRLRAAGLVGGPDGVAPGGVGEAVGVVTSWRKRWVRYSGLTGRPSA